MENLLIELDGIFAMKYEISPAWSEFLSAIARREPFFARELTESLVEDLFYLEEPWCGRFLELVANMATDWAWCGQRPTREEVTVWLGADLRL